MIYRGSRRPSTPATYLVVAVVIVYAIAVELSGIIAIAALIDMLIIPELFIDPGFILLSTGSIFVFGNILAVGMIGPLTRFAEGQPMFFNPTSGTSPFGMPKWFQDFGWFAEEHPDIEGEDDE